MKVSTYVSGAVLQFSYWFAHGTLDHPLLEGIGYTGEPPFAFWETELHTVSKDSHQR